METPPLRTTLYVDAPSGTALSGSSASGGPGCSSQATRQPLGGVGPELVVGGGWDPALDRPSVEMGGEEGVGSGRRGAGVGVAGPHIDGVRLLIDGRGRPAGTAVEPGRHHVGLPHDRTGVGVD